MTMPNLKFTVIESDTIRCAYHIIETQTGRLVCLDRIPLCFYVKCEADYVAEYMSNGTVEVETKEGGW